MIKIANAILCLNINFSDSDDSFCNCHLRSIRSLGLNTKEKQLYENEYSKIEDIKWSKK